MVFCRISEIHNNDSPPAGVVKVKVSGDPGTYNVRAIKSYDNSLFAGPKEFKIPDNTTLDIPILECKENSSDTLKAVSIIIQAAEEDGEYKDKDTGIINYKCA